MTAKPSDIATIEAAVVALRRAQRRRALARLSRLRGERESGPAALPDAVFELLDVLAVAADEGQHRTVTEAAVQLDVDQPRASRLVALALDAGLLRRAADQGDGRRSLLVLTTDGEAALQRIRRFRQAVITEATEGWSDRDRAALARLLHRFVHDFAAVTDGGSGRRA